jgi:hypothetical protein
MTDILSRRVLKQCHTKYMQSLKKRLEMADPKAWFWHTQKSAKSTFAEPKLLSKAKATTHHKRLRNTHRLALADNAGQGDCALNLPLGPGRRVLACPWHPPALHQDPLPADTPNPGVGFQHVHEIQTEGRRTIVSHTSESFSRA